MKYTLTLLLVFALLSCSSPAGHAVEELGNTVKKCCVTLTSIDKKPVNLSRVASEPSSSTIIPMSIFEIEGQLFRTW